MNRLEQLIQIYNEDPADSFIRFALAKEYEKQGDVEKALQYYTGLVKEQPEYTGTYYHLAKLYEQRGDLEKAKHTYEEGIAMAEQEGDQLSVRELKEAYMILKTEM